MIKNISVGIDLGTHSTKVVVCEHIKGEKSPRVIGIGVSKSSGIKNGYIINVNEATKSIQRALIEAEKNSSVKIKKAFISIGGISLESTISNGSVTISKADGEVTHLDIKKALTEAEEGLKLQNKKISELMKLKENTVKWYKTVIRKHLKTIEEEVACIAR